MSDSMKTHTTLSIDEEDLELWSVESKRRRLNKSQFVQIAVRAYIDSTTPSPQVFDDVKQSIQSLKAQFDDALSSINNLIENASSTKEETEMLRPVRTPQTKPISKSADPPMKWKPSDEQIVGALTPEYQSGIDIAMSLNDANPSYCKARLSLMAEGHVQGYAVEEMRKDNTQYYRVKA